MAYPLGQIGMRPESSPTLNKRTLLKALMRVSLGALGAFVVTFVVYFWNLDMKLTSVMEGIMLKHYDKIDRDQHL